MVELRKENVRSVKDIWCRLFSANPALAPFMDYDHHIYWRKTGALHDRFQNMPWKKTYYVAYDNGEPICVIPLCGKKQNRKIMAYSEGIAYLDFIYPASITDEQLAEIIGALQKTEQGTVHLEYLPPDSRLIPVLESMGIKSEVHEECVHIPIGDGYETYSANFTRNTRQNINKGWNRIARDNKNWRVEMCYGKGIPAEYTNQIAKISARRLVEIRGDKKYRYAIKYIKSRFLNPTRKYLADSKKAFFSAIFIDESIAAFMYGVIQENKTVVIPKIAYNSEFGQYNPGKLLVNETVKYLTENTDINVLDLANGTEEYKFQMGGVSHYTYKAELICGK